MIVSAMRGGVASREGLSVRQSRRHEQRQRLSAPPPRVLPPEAAHLSWTKTTDHVRRRHDAPVRRQPARVAGRIKHCP